MDPDVAQAVPELVRRGILTEQRALPLVRIARGELVSVFPELRLSLYAGALLIAAGAGILIERNYERIGPVAVALAVGACAAAALGWTARSSPPFSWGEVPAPTLAFEYVLLLGVLLGAADLAFIEYRFTPVGANWPWHLAVVSLLILLLAVRFDSRIVFSLALSTFAAWRGVSTSLVEHAIWHSSVEVVRWNAAGCGILFVALGRFCAARKRKAHFEPPAVHLGCLLVLGAFVSGAADSTHEASYAFLLIAAGSALAWYALVRRRFALFAFGVLGAYIAMSLLVVDAVPHSIWYIVSAAGLIALLWRIQRKMKEPL